MPDLMPADYALSTTLEILSTSESGDKLARQANRRFDKVASDIEAASEVIGEIHASAGGVVIEVDPRITKQTLLGIGTSFTESSAFVLAHLSPVKRRDVMQRIYGEQGANFSLARTPIGSTDFSVEGKYCYAATPGDVGLDSFSVQVDRDGFDQSQYPGIKDESFDVLPMIQQALAIKAGQSSSDLKIIASAWTAPPWMKTIEDWYIKPGDQNNYQGTGGELKQQYISTYADYLVKYLDAYRAEGVAIWGLTPVNEPSGNSGQWESMQFTPESQNDFIKQHLGPKLQASAYAGTKLLIYDHNRDGLELWADVLFADSETAEYIYGAAVHWYESSYLVYEDVFEKVHAKYPQFALIHTEGTIDDLGKDAPDGILDPDRFKESGWFMNDAFWWNANATDWAYTATWAPNPQDHPIYTPVHRYARNIIVSLDHWVAGWIDWNIVLDKNGGPNHEGNFCGAPIMIDTQSGEVYYTPIYYVLAQLSQTIRPGDCAVQTQVQLGGLDSDTLHASASINCDQLLSVQLLNTSKAPVAYQLKIGAQRASISIDANALQTVRVQL